VTEVYVIVNVQCMQDSNSVDLQGSAGTWNN